jgi:hypothetical protein
MAVAHLTVVSVKVCSKKGVQLRLLLDIGHDIW